jgi:hypothetical protein
MKSRLWIAVSIVVMCHGHAGATSPSPVAIKLDREDGATFVYFAQRQGWTNYVLQHRNNQTGEWQDYQLLNLHQGPLSWIKYLSHRVEQYFRPPTLPRPMFGMVPKGEKFACVEIAAEEVDAPKQWRLIATPIVPLASINPKVEITAHATKPVTGEFNITSEALDYTFEDLAVGYSVIPVAMFAECEAALMRFQSELEDTNTPDTRKAQLIRLITSHREWVRDRSRGHTNRQRAQ